MLIDAIRGMMSGDYWSLISLLISLPVILFSLTFHECAHGWAAKKCGDRTAENLGRLTLDPLKHLDPIGFLCMLVCGFGWAKPVPINSRNFRNPRRDMALTALAGPVSNLLLGFVCLFLFRLSLYLCLRYSVPVSETENTVVWVLLNFLSLGARLNVYLAVFNLIPIPPFDGSRIFFIFLPVKWYFGIMKYERFIQIGLLLLLWTGVLTLPLQTVSNGILSLMEKPLNLLFSLG